MAEISMITPVWCDISSKIDWLDEMIQSVRMQTAEDWELILINDQSPLSIDTIRAKYADDKRLRWFENAANVGPAMTRNTAVALAESDCILPIDSDDLAASDEVLDTMFEIWSLDKTKIIYGNLQMFLPSGIGNQFKRSKIIELGQYTFELAMNLEGIMPVTAMHSKECHEAAGGWKPEFSTGLEDVEYWIAAGERGYCGQKINYTTLVYRRQEESRAYKLKHVSQTYRDMQLLIKSTHSDIYKGVFPVACCGKGATNAPANNADPLAISQQNQNKEARYVTPLEGYEEKQLEWVSYQGPKLGRFGNILTKSPRHLPQAYTVLGKGHYFQIHKLHKKLFEDRARLQFVVNEPDPRQQPEPVTPEPVAAIQQAAIITEMPRPQLSTIVRLDAIAAQTRDVEIIAAPPPPPPSFVDLGVLELGPAMTQTLNDSGYTVEKLAESTWQELVALPGIGSVRANTIIAKAKQLLIKV